MEIDAVTSGGKLGKKSCAIEDYGFVQAYLKTFQIETDTAYISKCAQ